CCVAGAEKIPVKVGFKVASGRMVAGPVKSVVQVPAIPVLDGRFAFNELAASIGDRWVQLRNGTRQVPADCISTGIAQRLEPALLRRSPQVPRPAIRIVSSLRKARAQCRQVADDLPHRNSRRRLKKIRYDR